MKTVEEIAQAILRLPPAELARLREWLDDFGASRFDTAIEQDALAGRLDRFADEALADLAKRKASRRG